MQVEGQTGWDIAHFRIMEMIRREGAAYVGYLQENINMNGDILTLYDPDVAKLGYDFCIPVYDKDIVAMIHQWIEIKDCQLLLDILNRITRLKGEILMFMS